MGDWTGPLSQLNVTIIPMQSFNVTQNVPVPWLPIHGDIKIQGSLKDQNGQWVTCIVVDVQIAAAPAQHALRAVAEEVNADPTVTWKAGHNTYWDNWSVQDIKRMMGVVKNPNIHLPTRDPYSDEIIASLPDELDPRNPLGGNATCIGPVLDQGKCGSCWAFGAAEAISDRLCMHASGVFTQLAPLDLVACDQNDGGCEGGDPGSAWQYATNGLALDSCIPYLTSEGGPVPTCAPADEPCLDFVNTPSCPSACNSGGSVDRSHSVATVYNVNGVTQMQAELDQNGPFEVAFTVYSDFLTYKSGVYTYQSGDELGGHAVKMIGYGTDSGVDYWLCQNSWTTSWGDGGFFKIRRGTDECGIEDDVVAGTIAN